MQLELEKKFESRQDDLDLKVLQDFTAISEKINSDTIKREV
jgi:hypothetical protein